MYTRLQTLGICVSHKSALRSIKAMGVNFDAEVINWRDTIGSFLFTSPDGNSSGHTTADTPEKSQAPSGYIIVGDNIDKNVAPRDMRVDHQVKSLHHFHSYAALNRVHISSHLWKLSSDAQHDINSIPVSTFLPSVSDCVAFKSNYTILAARIIADDIPFFQHLRKCVPNHILHQHSEEMKKQSVTVSI